MRHRAQKEVLQLDQIYEQTAAEDLLRFLRTVRGSKHYEKPTIPAHLYDRGVDEIRAVLRYAKKGLAK